jgi:NTE family protein
MSHTLDEAPRPEATEPVSAPTTRRSASASKAPPTQRILNLALQGGGAHGAFTWGVLDALLQAPELAFEGLSGSSAGAMNAVVLADGWAKGGREGARAGLDAFWREVGKLMPLGMVTQGDGETISLSPASRLLVSWSRLFTPSQLNPMGINPLRSLLNRLVDFERLRAASPFKLFVGTTQATTGKLRVFREQELTVDVLLASACLPKLHHPIDIDGEPYWDGGYSANPAVFPLFYECEAADVLLVLLDPLVRSDAPRTVEQIEQRITELAFSAPFLREMQTFARAAEYAESATEANGKLENKLQSTRFHMIDANDLASLQKTETKALAHGPFLELLHGQGRERAAQWLSESAPQVGQRSTVDVRQWFA